MIFVLLFSIFFASATLPAGQVVAASNSEQLESMSSEELQEEKLRQEILQLRQENQRKFWGFLTVYAPFLTALAALAGILLTLWKQISETSRQKDLDRKQRQAEREQRVLENKRRIDEQFSSIGTSLGSKSEAIRAGAAVSMAIFSKSGYEEYYAQAFMLILANLKIDHTSAVNSLLVNSFERIAASYLPSSDEPSFEGRLDFSYAKLPGAELSGLNLTGVDLGFAELQRANFTGTLLKNARGYEANCQKARFSKADLQAARFHKAQFQDCLFHDAKLIDAKLRDANLEGAQFHRGQLQGAHFDRAQLKGALFHQANLNEASFTDAKHMTPRTMKSIILATNWQKAHFDDAVRNELNELNELAKERNP